MDDLSGLSWSPSPADSKKPPPMSSGGSLFSNLRPTPPLSGRSTPLSTSSTSQNPAPKSTTPANDSFASLVSFSSTPAKGLSLQEQQRQLQERKAREEAEKRRKLETQYGGNNAQFWDTLGSGGNVLRQASGPLAAGTGHPKSSSPSIAGYGPSGSQPKINQDLESEDDILAAFNSSAPVDASTNFPIPTSSESPSVDLGAPMEKLSVTGAGSSTFDEDDDPFGLSEMTTKATSHPAPPQKDDDDDVLGLLSKPVSEFPKPKSPEPVQESRSPPPSADPRDRAVAELVDMGFPADKARHALATTESGSDVQAAVGWLLNQAHVESQQKAKAGRMDSGASENEMRSGRRTRAEEAEYRGDRSSSTPNWMRNGQRSSSRTPNNADKDAASAASDFGTTFFKTANSLWKTGSKKVQQAMQDLNVDADPNQPKWMRNTTSGSDDQGTQQRRTVEKTDPTQKQGPGNPFSQNEKKKPDFTDEAMLLESGGGPSRKANTRPRQNPETYGDQRQQSRSPASFAGGSVSRQERQPVAPAFLRHQNSQNALADPKSRLSKQAVEEQSSNAYVSPARRKRPTAPAQQPPSARPDLFESRAPSSQSSRPSSGQPPSHSARSSKTATPVPPRPKAPLRQIPSLSPSSLSSSHQHREKASEAYKRGDYATAHTLYSSALSALPDRHPITIILLSNRALTGLKVGEPKGAISDADAAISVIGLSKGEGEKIDLGNGEPTKEMKDFYGKALMRKAEALEQLEKWTDAAKVWRDAVESGHGGSTSIQGRNRCEMAAGITSAATPRQPAQPKKPTPAPKKASALDDIAGRPPAVAASSAEAVQRLRAANAAADRADDEKFALADSIDARLTAWKGGKQDNLRALLGSLDTILWPEAGWKKISMAELVLPNKVKIQYMKGIAKVHPDKLPTSATTEQKMISAAVFSTLNEAWDKFKKENGM